MKSRRTLIVVSVFLGLAVAGVLISLFTGGDVPNRASSMSRSLIGHRGVVELLRRNGFRITINRRTRPSPAGEEGLAVFAPPPPDEQPTDEQGGKSDSPSWRRLTDRFRPQMVVLPKWDGLTHPSREEWILITQRFETEEIERVLPDGEGWSIGHWTGSNGNGDEPGNRYTVRSRTGRTFPVRSQVLQYFDGDVPGTVLWSVGERPVAVRENDTDRVWVSDPDLLSNMFLDVPENAGFALALFEDVFPERRFLVDELHRGFGIQESLMELLFTFPGLILTLNVTFLMLCFYWWLYNGWSGRAQERAEERRRLEQAEAMGRLTHAHGEHAYAGRLYVDHVRSLTADAINLPEKADWSRIVERLEHLRPSLAERLRALGDDLSRLNGADPDHDTILHLARQVNLVYDQLGHDVREGSEEQTSEGN